MYLKIYKKLEYENMSSNFYECLLWCETKATISKFYKKKLYQVSCDGYN